MAELSRSEKLAFAHQKLKKFRDSRGIGTSYATSNGEPNYSTPEAYFSSASAENPNFFVPPVATYPPIPSEDSNARFSAKPRSLAEYFGSAQNSTDASQGQSHSVFFIPSTNDSDVAPSDPYFPVSSCVSDPKSFVLTGDAIPHVSDGYPGNGDGFIEALHVEAVETKTNMPAFDQPFAVHDGTCQLNLDDGDDAEQFGGTMPTATTERIMQLSQQLNGILQTSEQLTTSFTSSVGGFSSYSPRTDLSGPCSASHPNIHGQSSRSPVPFTTNMGSPDSGTLDRSDFKRSASPTSVHSANITPVYVRELEERNVELAALVDKRSRAHERAMTKLTTTQDQLAKAQSQAASERASLEQSANRDLARAHEQIRAHAQTVGVLVAEKTELQTKLSHLEQIASERSNEINVLDDRLQNYRQQSLDLERVVTTLKSNMEKMTSDNSDLSSQLVRLKSDSKRERASRENVDTELQEAYSKLNAKQHEMSQLELRVNDLMRQLELAQVYANQLVGESTPTDRDGELGEYERYSREHWITERTNFVNRIDELEATALQASKDRGRLESQYKTLVTQVEREAVELRSQLTNANKSNQELLLSLEQTRRSLRERENALAESTGKLEIAMTQQAVSTQLASPSRTEDEDSVRNGDVKTTPSDRMQQLQELANDQHRDLERFTLEMVSIKEKLAEAETAIQEKDRLLADRDTVLATATSERSALSRAMEQNRTLKQELTELQDAFVSMSNNNLELTTELQRGQNALKESSSIQHDYRGQLERLQEHCAKREAEYNALTQAYEALSRQLKLTNQVILEEQATTTAQTNAEETQRSESCDPQVHADNLMKELQNNQRTIDILSTRLELFESIQHQIKLMLIWLRERESTTNKQNGSNSEKLEDPLELVETLKRLMQSMITQRDQDVALQAEQNRHHLAKIEQLPSLDEWQALQVAHTQLEAKFLQCMDKLSTMSEERAKLESIVTQLEMEASTVGEYVTLFAHRRANAARRAKAREQLLGRLVQDRVRLRNRLQHLRNLIPQPQGETEPSSETIEQDGVIINPTENEQLQHTFLDQFQCFLDEICPNADEGETELGFSVLSDEDVDELAEKPAKHPTIVAASATSSLEQLRLQALQHDCPHCQCCVGTLLEI